MNEQIGRSIKQARKNINYTLNDLSEKSGLSVSYLSTVERGVNSPTIANLQKICSCLSITFNELIFSLEQEQIVVKAEDREGIFNSDNNVKYEAITVGDRDMKAMCMTIYDKSEHISSGHISDEFGYVVEGSVKLTVSSTDYVLSKGDTIYIKANSSHSFVKLSDEVCVTIWVYDNTRNNDIMPNLLKQKPKGESL